MPTTWQLTASGCVQGVKGGCGLRACVEAFRAWVGDEQAALSAQDQAAHSIRLRSDQGVKEGGGTAASGSWKLMHASAPEGGCDI